MKRSKGTIQMQIGRTSGSREFIHIQIMDEVSRVRMVEMEMSFEDFAKCVTGYCVQNVPAEFDDLSKVGKKLEVKSVPIIGLDDRNWQDREELVKPYEVDGWQADIEREYNFYNHREDRYTMVFKRWV